MIKKLNFAILGIVFFAVSSCSDNTNESLHGSNLVEIIDSNVSESQLLDVLKIEETKHNELDFESLLSHGNLVQAIDVSGAIEFTKDKYLSRINAPVKASKIQNKDLEAETAFKNLEVNSLEHKKSIENLRTINQLKDQTIASLSLLNDELITEIKRIKGDSYRENISINATGNSINNLDSLKFEVKKLKNNLTLKSEELKSLRFRNDSLEGRISDLELSPNVNSIDLLPRLNSVIETDRQARQFHSQNRVGLCNLQFEAVVTALNGKSKEAFYTEFFILPTELENIMRKGGIVLTDYSGIDTYAELWARSRKNSFLFPDVHKKFRSLLLDLEDRGEGKRVRTDVDGSASVIGLPKGKYYVIGTASLGKVGVTWSVPVSLNAGNNKISLTLANCSWSL
tara:strand:- start:98 stop:1291 length:1194 start_codon:yes stop_codon:yes gene_type:complete